MKAENNKEEEVILIALKRKFTENKEILSSELKRHKKVLELLAELNEEISPKPKKLDDQKLDSLMFGIGWLPQFTPKDGVINSLVNSGKISLIKNNELSSKLSSWNSLINTYYTTYKWTENDVFEQVLPYIKTKYPFRRTLRYFGNASTGNSKFEYSKDDLLSDLGFESILSNRIINARDILDAAQELNIFQEEVLNLIETELTK
ncbi:hypothetical protein AAGF08_04260 [Algoriphagus sp. SE2]|uniref:hypothetical protein n=1 Tax=Algoriphagus sp. SE2 TaxID=3141536 RepID=UPI0031CD4835